jgi:hypothetical protein
LIFFLPGSNAAKSATVAKYPIRVSRKRDKSKEEVDMANFKTLGAVRATFLLLLAAVGCGLVLAPAAHADAIYNLTFDGCTGGCGPQGSFGTVDLHQVDSDTVEISVSLLNNNEFLTTGSHTGFSFNFQGADVTLGPLPTGWSDAGANVTQPSFGLFAHGINCDQGNSNSKNGCAGNNPWVGLLSFNVSRASGLSLSDFTTNTGGFTFATDILSGTNGKTGLVAAGGPEVPEPGTLVMMGTGAMGLAGVIRRKIRG